MGDFNCETRKEKRDLFTWICRMDRIMDGEKDSGSSPSRSRCERKLVTSFRESPSSPLSASVSPAKRVVNIGV